MSTLSWTKIFVIDRERSGIYNGRMKSWLLFFVIITMVALSMLIGCNSEISSAEPPYSPSQEVKPEPLPNLAPDLQPQLSEEKLAPPSNVEPEPLPMLHVVGNQIIDANGEIVILRGVAIADPFCLANQYHHFVSRDYSTISKDWGANIIRVPISPDLWEHDSSYMEKYLDPLVEWGREFSLYIFIAWHAHGNALTGEVEPTPWGDSFPWHGNPYNPNLQLAKSALGAIAERYRDKPWVLYGTFNEPSYIEWSEWRPIAEELVDVIHGVHPGAVVFVSGTDWGYDLSGALEDPVRRNNVIYETHPYPGKGEDWKTVLDALRKSSPVFLGEWGFDRTSGDANLRAGADDYGLPLVEYARQRNIGWTAWIFHFDWGIPMLWYWDYRPTEFGLLVKNNLQEGLEP